MSAIQAVAIRSQNELDRTYAELESLYVRRSQLESTKAKNIRSGIDTQDITQRIRTANKEIESKKALIEELGSELRTAIANLAAEQQLAELRDAERLKVSEQQQVHEAERTDDVKPKRYWETEVDDLDLGR